MMLALAVRVVRPRYLLLMGSLRTSPLPSLMATWHLRECALSTKEQALMPTAPTVEVPKKVPRRWHLWRAQSPRQSKARLLRRWLRQLLQLKQVPCWMTRIPNQIIRSLTMAKASLSHRLP